MEDDSLGLHLGSSGKGELSANQKSPVGRHNTEPAGQGGRRAEKMADRRTSFPVGGGTGERVQGDNY